MRKVTSGRNFCSGAPEVTTTVNRQKHGPHFTQSGQPR